MKQEKTQVSLTASQIAGVYIGAVIGAGFASGQEIWQFFGLLGRGGFLGLMLSSVLFAAFAFLLLELGRRLAARSHLEVVTQVAGRFWGSFLDAFLTVSLPATLMVMLAGAGAGLAEQYSVPVFVGSTAMMLATIITVLMGIQGVVSAISLMAPFLLGIILLICVLALRVRVVDWSWALASVKPGMSWLMSALSYVAYNLLLSVSILAPMGAVAERQAILWGAVLGGLGLGISATAVNVAVLSQGPAVIGCDVPMLLVAKKALPHATWVFTVLLIVEIYTTAVASLYGFGARLAPRDPATFERLTVITGCVALVGGQVGFTRLVAVIYGTMGYVGAAFLLILTWWAIRDVKSRPH